MWNERYSEPEFAYGTAPNVFLAANVALLRGPVLSLAEGEGRKDLLMDHGDLERQFRDWDILLAQTIERKVLEGKYHTGSAVVVQFIAQPRASLGKPD